MYTYTYRTGKTPRFSAISQDTVEHAEKVEPDVDEIVSVAESFYVIRTYTDLDFYRVLEGISQGIGCPIQVW